MSIYSALNVGVTALQAQSNKLSVISDNIANVSTVGYKQGVADFETLIASDTVGDYSPGGVLGGNKSANGQQGEIIGTSSSTDIAIAGNGFIPVTQDATTGSALSYTRAGSFTPDQDGNFVNTAGYFLQGWQLDTNGNLPAALSVASPDSGTAIAALSTVNVAALTQTSEPTTTVSLHANLDASQAIWAGTPAYNANVTGQNMASGGVSPQFDNAVSVIDSTGATHNLDVAFLKTGANSWSVEIFAKPASDVTETDGQVASGTITFNGDGTLASVTGSIAQPVTVNWSAATPPATTPAASSITFNWGTAGVPFGTPNATLIGRTDGLSQFAGDFNIQSVQKDGVSGGSLSSVSITDDGYVTGTYSDGSARNFYKIPLAEFVDPTQLQSDTGDVFTQGADSGSPSFVQAGSDGAGKIDASALESSNVDLSSQLTDMIIAQRAYQANTKTINTTDEMLQTLDQMLV